MTIRTEPMMPDPLVQLGRENDELLERIAALETEAAHHREAIASREDAIHAAAREIAETRAEMARLRSDLLAAKGEAAARVENGSHECDTRSVRPLAMSEDERILGGWRSGVGIYRCECGRLWKIETVINSLPDKPWAPNDFKATWTPVVCSSRVRARLKCG